MSLRTQMMFSMNNNGLLVDKLPASLAFSLRKLSMSATNCIRVRRSSDNSEQNIGFASDLLDVTAMLNFVGNNNGFIVKWYDQSGNSNDLQQNSNSIQPLIVSNGTVNLINGKPAIFFSDSKLVLSSNESGAAPFSVVTVVQKNNGNQGVALTSGTHNAGSYTPFHYSDNIVYLRGNSTLFYFDPVNNFGQNLFFGVYKTAPVLEVNNSPLTVTGQGAYTYGAMTGMGWWDSANSIGNIQELIKWDSDLTSEKNYIKNNVNTFFSVY